MDISELILPVLVLGIVLVMLILAASNRVIAKLGLRNFFRHKGHAAISITGLLVGTSIICASMVVGDSIEYYIVEDTYRELELVDMVVSGDMGSSFGINVYEDLRNDAAVSGLTDGMSPLYVKSVTVRNSATGLFEPSVNLVGFDAAIDRDFGEFILEDNTTSDGSSLAPGHIIINRPLADDLSANVGDVLNVTYTQGYSFNGLAEPEYIHLTIAHIAADEGKSRYAPGGNAFMGSGDFNIFLDISTAQNMFLEPGKITHIKISNNGGVMDGAKLSEDVTKVVEPILKDLRYPATDQQYAMMPNQTFIMLNNSNVIDGTFSLEVNGVRLDAQNYSLNRAYGMVTMLTPLQPGDLIIAEYDYTYSLEISAVKQSSLDMARMFNDIVSMFLTIFGGFAIIAGVILIINIFTMLAEERKSELGMARAVGMKRRHLMQSFLFEGLAYGSIASALGVGVGLGVGYVLIYLVNELLSFINVQLPFYFKLFSLAEAFSLGFIITFGTILLTSWKISKLNIMQAIRGIEEPQGKRKGHLMILFGGLIAATSAAFYFNYPDEALAILLGPSGMATGIAMILWRWIGSRASIVIASLFTFIYSLYAIRTSLGNIGMDQMDMVFIISGVIIVLSLVLLIMYNSRPVILAITNTFGRIRKFRPTVMTAVSYPLTKKFRTGMSVAMFALVIYMIVMLSVFSGMFVIDVDKETAKQGGGFDIQADLQIPVMDLYNVTRPMSITSPTLHNNITAITQISQSYAIEANVTDLAKRPSGIFGMNFNFTMGSIIYGIDNNFHEERSFEFSKKLDAYENESAVWNAVMAPGSDKLVLNTMMGMILQAEPGNHIIFTTMTGNLTREYEVIAILEQNMLMGAFMSRSNAMMEFGAMGMVNSVFLLELEPGMDPVATADALERDFAAVGMNTVIIRDEVEQTMDTTNSLFVLFELYLDMGLVVGVAGLGIITIRSVVERTPEIGILRSLGFKRKNVRNAFLIEILFIATLGVIIGTITGVVVSHEIFNIVVKDFAQNIEFTVPWVKIAYVTAIAYIVTILCTIIPARNASKISPAEALRYVG